MGENEKQKMQGWYRSQSLFGLITRVVWRNQTMAKKETLRKGWLKKEPRGGSYNSRTQYQP